MIIAMVSAVLLSVVVGLIAYHFGARKTIRLPVENLNAFVKRTNNGAKAFGKPSGKKKPKVHDDAQAWRQENDLN